MVSCWQERPEARPAFQTIGDYFEWIIKESEKTADISVKRIFWKKKIFRKNSEK